MISFFSSGYKRAFRG